MGERNTILRLALNVPLRQLFDYILPDGCPVPQPGCRVQVRFRGRLKTAFVVEVVAESPVAAEKLLAIESILDDRPLWNPALGELLRWCEKYYHHPPGEIFTTAIPPLLRGREALQAPSQSVWQLTPAGQAVDLGTLGKRAPRQAQVLAAVSPVAGVGQLDLRFADFDWRGVVRKLIDKGWLRVCEDRKLLNRPAAGEGPLLTGEQETALAAMSEELETFRVHLLYGVTGSGKTEVYLRLAQAVLARNRQVLMLVPEIGLVPQLVRRVEKRLGVEPAVMHSGQSRGDRYRAWYRAFSGEAEVVIGTRSAVFTSMPSLGLIVVDEEHDSAYKQQDHWRYHARDVAVKRASLEGCPLVLGSATPSLESLANVDTGRYRYSQLLRRAGCQPLPEWRLLEMRKQAVVDGLLPETLEMLAENIRQGQQSLVFLNRRGFAPVLICGWCGWQADCERCDSPRTWHQQAAYLACHRCDTRRPVPQRCPACDSLDLCPLGEGTERVVAALEKHFPATPVIRFDADSTRRKNAAADILDRVASGEPCILVGTQMLAKGHHLPRVSLAVILNVDQSLFSSDFRAIEKLGQLLVQVAGRSGRGRTSGQVVLQTYHPNHPQLQLLLQAGYPRFAGELLEERWAANLPPASYQAILRGEATDLDLLTRALVSLQESMERSCLELDEGSGALAYGPMPALQARRAGRYRMQVVLQASQRSALHWLVELGLQELRELPARKKIRWALDIDPQEL